MDEREQERLRLAREVGKLLHHRSFRDMLPPLTYARSARSSSACPTTPWARSPHASPRSGAMHISSS